MVRAANRQTDLAMVTAWHTARFALNGYANKGRLAGSKTLSDFLVSENREKPRRSKFADAHAFFSRLKARGVPIETKH